MGKISFTLSAITGITNDIIAVIYKTTSPSAEVDRIVVDNDDLSSPSNFQFNDLEDGVYLVNIHESSDGTTLGNLRHDWFQDAVTNSVVTTEKRFYTVDGLAEVDPPSEQKEIPDEYLDGKTILGVFKEGFRYLEPELEWTSMVGGGVELLTGPDLSAGEKIMIEVALASVSSSPMSNDAFSQFEIVTGDVTLDSSHYNKTILVRASGNKQTTELPLSVPDGKGFIIRHDGGNAVNVVIDGNGATLRFRGADKSAVILGKGEFIKVIKNGSEWIVNDDRGQWDRVGEVVAARMAGDNMLLCDGTTEYDLTVYLRLAEFIDSLPSSQIVDYSDFATTANKGFFAVDTVNNKCKLPMMFDMSIRFLKNNGGSDSDRTDNIPGGYQAGMVGDFTATVTGRQAAAAGGNGGVPNFVALKSTMVPPFTGSTEAVSGISIVTGKETVTKNYGFLPYILI